MEYENKIRETQSVFDLKLAEKDQKLAGSNEAIAKLEKLIKKTNSHSEELAKKLADARNELKESKALKESEEQRHHEALLELKEKNQKALASFQNEITSRTKTELDKMAKNISLIKASHQEKISRMLEDSDNLRRVFHQELEDSMKKAVKATASAQERYSELQKTKEDFWKLQEESSQLAQAKARAEEELDLLRKSLFEVQSRIEDATNESEEEQRELRMKIQNLKMQLEEAGRIKEQYKNENRLLRQQNQRQEELIISQNSKREEKQEQINQLQRALYQSYDEITQSIDESMGIAADLGSGAKRLRQRVKERTMNKTYLV